MTANDVSRIGTPSLFQGLTFKQTPKHPFGWILFPTQTKRTLFQKDALPDEVNRWPVVRPTQ
jgi:hypothetical protein